MKERRFYFIIALLVLLAITAPYLYAFQAGGAEGVFGGFLINAQDGNSYLAKMRQGWEGSWKFHLTYTPDSGQGAWFIYILYLVLGHLARLLNLPLLMVFHLARVAGALGLLWALSRFWAVTFPTPRQRKLAFAVSALTSGVGWLAIPFGAITSDFWVAEAYPFLSAYTNPHFSLSLAFMLALLAPGELPNHSTVGRNGISVQNNILPSDLLNRPTLARIPLKHLWQFLASLALSLMSPFGVVIVVMVLGGDIALSAQEFIQQTCSTVINLLSRDRQIPAKKLKVSPLARESSESGDPSRARMASNYLLINPKKWKLVAIILGGVPIPLYEVWVTRVNPVFRGWNAQNLTPSPPSWDLLLAFSPALILAIIGARSAWREKNHLRVLVIWTGLSLILVYVPWNLQRRFMMGLYIPLSGLAALGLDSLAKKIKLSPRTLGIVFFLLALPTNLLVIFSGIHAARERDPSIYLSAGEVEALAWIETHTPPDALILTGPETGLHIPARTGRRVLYGHPYETVNAESARATVTAFFAGEMTPDQAQSLLQSREVDYILITPRENSPLLLGEGLGVRGIFISDTVQIYQVTQ